MTSVVVAPTRTAVEDVDDPATGRRVRRTRISTTITVGEVDHELWYLLDPDVAPPEGERGNIWMPLAMLAGMRTGLPVRSADPVSALLIEHLHEVQEIWAFWWGWPQVELIAPMVAPSSRFARRPRPRSTGTFFTGGIDSFHTLLRRSGEVDHLIYGNGFEHASKNGGRLRQVRELLDRAGREIDASVLVADTNVRDFVKAYGTWGSNYGVAMSSLAHVFSAVVDKIYLPAAYTYADPDATGSSPLLDHWWSSDRVRIRNDGAAATRFTKLEMVSAHPLALANLRVCGRSQPAMNCGECVKCVGAMIGLQALGRLEQAPFPDHLDLDVVRSIKPGSRLSFINLEETHRVAARTPGMEAVASAVRDVIEDFTRRFDEVDAAGS